MPIHDGLYIDQKHSDNFYEALGISTKLCMKFEGLRLRPYICPAGYPSIGYGTVFYPNDTKVTMEDPPIDQERAEILLFQNLRTRYFPGVLKASPHLIKYPKVLGAIGDFAYNLGVSAYCNSTLRKKIDEENWEGAKKELMKWVHGGGKVLPGLVKRRQAECETF